MKILKTFGNLNVSSDKILSNDKLVQFRGGSGGVCCIRCEESSTSCDGHAGDCTSDSIIGLCGGIGGTQCTGPVGTCDSF